MPPEKSQQPALNLQQSGTPQEFVRSTKITRSPQEVTPKNLSGEPNTRHLRSNSKLFSAEEHKHLQHKKQVSHITPIFTPEVLRLRGGFQPYGGDSVVCRFWNCDGWQAHQEEINLLLEDAAVCALVETWWMPVNSLPSHPNFNVVTVPATRKCKHGRPSGGITILIKCELDFSVIVKNSHLILIYLAQLDCFFIFTYFSFSRTRKASIDELSEVLSSFQPRKLLICGDFNLHIGQLGDLRTSNVGQLVHNPQICSRRTSQDLRVDHAGRLFLNFIEDNELVILNGAHVGDILGRFTFLGPVGSSVIDFAIVDVAFADSFTFNFSVLDSISAFHQVLSVEIKSKMTWKCEKRLFQYGKISWSEDTQPQFRSWLQEFATRLENQTQTENCVFLFAAAVKGFIVRANLWKPPREVKRQIGSHKPWFDSQCRVAKGQVSRALRLYKRQLTPESHQNFVSCRSLYKKTQVLAKSSYVTDLATRIFNDKSCTALWEALSKLNRPAHYEIPISNLNWTTQFTALYAENKVKLRPSLNLSPLRDTILDSPITQFEIAEALEKMKTKGAVGPNALPVQLWKSGGSDLLKILEPLFNHLLNSQIFPATWYEGWIIPIFKKGDRSTPSNYRPITLLNSMPKIFSSILASRLGTWQRTHHVIPREQMGFCPGQSCSDLLYILSTLVSTCTISQDTRIYAAFIDLTAAFDSVPHHLLWQQLVNQGVSVNFINTVKAAYATSSIRLKLPSGPGPRIPVKRGVLQGDPLSPALFNAYLYDAFDFLDRHAVKPVLLGSVKLHGLAYADDFVLMATTNNELRKKITLFAKYCSLLGLTINTNKTKVMVFRNSKPLNLHPKYSIAKQPLAVVKQFSYLGVLLADKNL